jgi:hypothetical protein
MKKLMSLKKIGGWIFLIGVIMALIIAGAVALYYFGKI